MLKNYALMGVACDKNKKGLITVTDNDLIEKSNLNRQFLFRNSDLQKPKSECAARAASAINPAIQVDAQLNRVSYFSLLASHYSISLFSLPFNLNYVY